MKLNLVFTRACNGSDAGVFTFIEGMSTILPGEVRCYCGRNILKLIRTWYGNREAVMSIHCIWGMSTLLLMALSRVQKRKLYVFPHGMCEPWSMNAKNKLLKLLVLKCIHLIANENFVFVCLSEMERENLRKLLPGKKIETLTPYVHSEALKWEKSEVKLNILFLGRLHIKKGINELLSVASQMPEDCELHIAGTGSPLLLNRIEDLIDSGVRIVYHGDLRGKAKWALYERCHALILPTFSENFGYVVPEALSAGCIILTTKNTPWPSLLTNMRGFIPIKNVTVNDILDAIDDLRCLILRTEGNHKKIYMENRNYFIQNFARNTVREKYQRLFS